MRISSPFLACVLLVLLSCAVWARVQATTSMFTSNLMLGSQGAQVIALQQMLNRDPDTLIAYTGPGSPGYETSYFGVLTRAAVIRFQEKYASETLSPAGITRGSGFVGAYTRAKLNILSMLTADSSLTPALPTVSTSPTSPANPNLQNIDTFLAAIDSVATKRGTDATTIATIKEQVLKEVATTTDLLATFVRLVEKNSPQAKSEESSFKNIVAAVGNALNSVFMPRQARAGVGLPFGGPLAFAFYCTCSFNWLITVGPLPPTYVTLLSYYPGSQAYLSYNIPATRWLLGEYTGGGVCLIVVPHGCLSLPTQGLITPVVGSSPG